MKISSFPDNRLLLINSALSGFFAGNSLPLVQITGSRAGRLKSWFNFCMTSRRWQNTATPAAEDQCIKIRWRMFDYDHSSNTAIHRDFYTKEVLKNLANHKLPSAVLQDVKSIKNVVVSVYHNWDYKSFYFRV